MNANPNILRLLGTHETFSQATPAPESPLLQAVSVIWRPTHRELVDGNDSRIVLTSCMAALSWGNKIARFKPKYAASFNRRAYNCWLRRCESTVKAQKHHAIT
jgi:hypothetical protein